jgi:hypothetical protein
VAGGCWGGAGPGPGPAARDWRQIGTQHCKFAFLCCSCHCFIRYSYIYSISFVDQTVKLLADVANSLRLDADKYLTESGALTNPALASDKPGAEEEKSAAPGPGGDGAATTNGHTAQVLASVSSISFLFTRSFILSLLMRSSRQSPPILLVVFTLSPPFQGHFSLPRVPVQFTSLLTLSFSSVSLSCPNILGVPCVVSPFQLSRIPK